MTNSMNKATDAELVARALRDDQQAVAEIYNRYVHAIYSFCRSRLRNDGDAADATQHTFVRAASRLTQLREPQKLRPWLYAIARNQILSTAPLASQTVDGEWKDSLASSDPRPEIDLVRVDMSAQLWEAADGLQPRDQEVLELHIRHGLMGPALAEAKKGFYVA